MRFGNLNGCPANRERTAHFPLRVMAQCRARSDHIFQQHPEPSASFENASIGATCTFPVGCSWRAIMASVVLLGITIVLQVIAAVFALRPVRIPTGRPGWVLLTLAVV